MWNIIQCAVQGRGHIKANIPCQDMTYVYNKPGLAIAALADGAGSASLSHYGAKHITEYICTDFVKHFDLYFQNENGIAVKQELIHKIQTQLYLLATEMNCEFKDLASTLLTIAIQEDRFILMHIGDGVIGYSKENELKIASQPENGEFANTTVFTTSKDVLQSMKLIKGRLGTVNGFILMSDGTEASLYQKQENRLANVLKTITEKLRIFPAAQVEAQLLHSFHTVIRNATTDDCSIIIMADNRSSLGYQFLPLAEKAALLQIRTDAKQLSARVKRYDQILKILTKAHTLTELSRKIHLKLKYAKKHLHRLTELGLVEKSGSLYRTIIVMDRRE